MRRRALTWLIVTGLTLAWLAAPVTGSASSSGPIWPSSIAAVGDSITQAASTGGTLGADAPQNSWSTGTNSTVNSHYLRLLGTGAPVTGRHNLSVSGARMVHLQGQMANAVSVQPGYLTVLIGGNDLCTDTVAQMTSTAAFETQFRAAMDTLTAGSPHTYVYVVSIPNVYQLWELFRSNFWARFVWATAGICQSLLANPTSTQQSDVERRLAVRQRNIEYNTVLGSVCAQYLKCRFDDNAVFNTAFTSSDVSGDYFHPSIAGQAKLAAVSWAAGYPVAPPAPANQAPTASFIVSCDGLACSFTDTSTDPDGSVVAWSWTFGDGSDSALRHPGHTYSGGDTYTVSLTVTDDAGANGVTSQLVTITAPEPDPDPPPSEPPPTDPPPPGTMHVAGLAGSATAGKGQAWMASVTIDMADEDSMSVASATVTGSWSTGGESTCTTDASGSCTVTLTGINAKKNSSVTLTVTDAAHAQLSYDAATNVESAIVIVR